MGYLVEWRVGSVLRAEGRGGHRDIVVLLRPGSSSLLAFGFEVSISLFLRAALPQALSARVSEVERSHSTVSRRIKGRAER